MGLGWVLCANSHPREAACLGLSPTGCRRQSEHSDPGPEARGRSSKTREWGQVRTLNWPGQKPSRGRGGGPRPPLTLAPGEQVRKGGPSSQVARRVALSILCSNKTLTQMTLCSSPNK